MLKVILCLFEEKLNLKQFWKRKPKVNLFIFEIYFTKLGKNKSFCNFTKFSNIFKGVDNPDEIDIDDESDEDEDEDAENGGEPVAKKSKIERQAIPSEVFGGLQKPDDD